VVIIVVIVHSKFVIMRSKFFIVMSYYNSDR
jgi:hypothetical protein